MSGVVDMFEKEKALEKSRLGELLVNKGLITNAQLDLALQEQRASGVRLGEVLMAKGWISERQLNRALTRQKSYRYAIAFAAAVSAPLTPILAMASPVEESARVELSVASTPSHHAESGLSPLNDDDLAQVTGQGSVNIEQEFANVTQNAAVTASNEMILSPGQATQNSNNPVTTLMAQFSPGANSDGVSMMVNVVKTILPLQADIKMNGVVFAKDSHFSSGLPLQIDSSGAMEVQMPQHIDSLVFSNIQVQGSTPGSATMGDVSLVGVNLNNTTIKVSVRS